MSVEADAEAVDVEPGGQAAAEPGRAWRPSLPEDVVPLYDWFETNGVVEWLPEGFGPVVVDLADRWLEYTSFVWQDERRGWDYAQQVVTEDGRTAGVRRRVPLVEPPGDEVVEAIATAARRYVSGAAARLAGTHQAGTELLAETARLIARNVSESAAELRRAQEFLDEPCRIADPASDTDTQ